MSTDSWPAPPRRRRGTTTKGIAAGAPYTGIPVMVASTTIRLPTNAWHSSTMRRGRTSIVFVTSRSRSPGTMVPRNFTASTPPKPKNLVS